MKLGSILNRIILRSGNQLLTWLSRPDCCKNSAKKLDVYTTVYCLLPTQIDKRTQRNDGEVEGGRHDHCWLELQISRYLDISVQISPPHYHHCSSLLRVPSIVHLLHPQSQHSIYASPSPGLSWCLCLKWSKAYYFNIHSLSTKWNANSRSAKDPNKTSQLLFAVSGHGHLRL